MYRCDKCGVDLVADNNSGQVLFGDLIAASGDRLKDLCKACMQTLGTRMADAVIDKSAQERRLRAKVVREFVADLPPRRLRRPRSIEIFGWKILWRKIDES